jgi:two-component system chemotaxis sensor kinase CheA
VRVQDGNLRLDGALRQFWTAFSHVVRNAFSHGFEPSEERVALGKPQTPALTISTALSADRFVVEVSDDGRGIDWERVAKVAASRGLETDTEHQRLAALFASGFSTRETADAMSGRGEGMSAVKEAVDALGGEIASHSEQGLGTTFRFTFASRLADMAERLSTRPPPRMESSLAH